MRCNAIISRLTKAGILSLDRFARCRVTSDLARIGRTMACLAGGKNSTINRFDLYSFHDWLFSPPKPYAVKAQCAPKLSGQRRRGPHEHPDANKIA